MASKRPSGLGKGLGALLGDDVMKTESSGSLSLPISQVESYSGQPRKHYVPHHLCTFAAWIRCAYQTSFVVADDDACRRCYRSVINGYGSRCFEYVGSIYSPPYWFCQCGGLCLFTKKKSDGVRILSSLVKPYV